MQFDLHVVASLITGGQQAVSYVSSYVFLPTYNV